MVGVPSHWVSLLLLDGGFLVAAWVVFAFWVVHWFVDTPMLPTQENFVGDSWCFLFLTLLLLDLLGILFRDIILITY